MKGRKDKYRVKSVCIPLTGLFVFILFSGFFPNAFAQETQELKPPSNQVASETPTPKSTPIPLSNIIIQADADASRLQIIRSEADKVSKLSKISEEIPVFSKDVDTRIIETKGLLAARPSLETLRKLEEDWQALAKKTAAWTDEIKIESQSYNKTLEELKNLKAVWELTLSELTKLNTSPTPEISEDENLNSENESDSKTVEIPTEVIDKVRAIIEDIGKTQKVVEQKQSKLLTIQTLISEQIEKTNNQVETVKEAHKNALSNLFVQDRLPIWRASEVNSSSVAVIDETQTSFNVQATAFQEYSYRNKDNFLLNGLVFLFFLIAMLWLRRNVSKWHEDDSRIERATIIFKFPVMIALLFSLLMSDLFYPQAPRMLSSLLQALALIPAIFILRRLLPKVVLPLLYTLVALYILGRFMELAGFLQFVTRLTFLFKMLAAFLFSLWFLNSLKKSSETEIGELGIVRILKVALPPVIVAFAIAFIANSFGYVALSRVLGNGILDSAIIALIFFVGFKVSESLVVLATFVRPLSLLQMMKSHREIIQKNVLRFLAFGGIVAWIIVTLNILSLRDYVFSFVSTILNERFETSAFSISLGDILAFGFTVWLAFKISRIVRFILEEDVYPRISFSGGVSYAVSTVLHYLVLLLGFVLAIASLGVDLSKFTILAGAFGVGLGFGLQNIVNNFVSGLFLLFERPVKVGDFVEVDNELGELTRIGLRASTIRTRDGSDLILPNGYLISEKVTNWTHIDNQRRLEIDVGVAYNSDPKQVLAILKEVALRNEDVLSYPEPNAVLISFGDNSLDFRLRAWTNIADQWRRVYSSIAVEIFEELKKAKVEIPFPQLDLHLEKPDKDLPNLDKVNKQESE